MLKKLNHGEMMDGKCHKTEEDHKWHQSDPNWFLTSAIVHINKFCQIAEFFTLKNWKNP